MLTLFGKKKLTEDKAANIFVNAVTNLIDQGYSEIASLINDSPEFVIRPCIGAEGMGPFTLIVLSANLQQLPMHLEAGQDKRVTDLILDKLARMYELDKMQLAQMIAETRQFMQRKNHPSKVVSSAMAKALFCRFELSKYQEEYFKTLDVPNPIFLQRLKEAMENFLWSGELFHQKYKLVQQV
jgi:hypothetical protein